EAVGAALRAHAGTLRTALGRLAGAVEWGLTVTWDPRPTPGPSTPVAPAADGRAYLRRRGTERAEAEELERRRAEVASDVHRAAEAAAEDSVLHRRLPRADGRPTVLRASYLVQRSAHERFEEAVTRRLAAWPELAVEGELTGPWPPYNFATASLEPAPA
ncbi:MAG TPA: GvpL/GvpF family gas vesicle protein, partial [Acidimicrobiales bacterium]|nr:GvpL/GvpF family gas vesicle protein [Acidimicrobiales bacterium]